MRLQGLFKAAYSPRTLPAQSIIGPRYRRRPVSLSSTGAPCARDGAQGVVDGRRGGPGGGALQPADIADPGGGVQEALRFLRVGPVARLLLSSRGAAGADAEAWPGMLAGLVLCCAASEEAAQELAFRLIASPPLAGAVAARSCSLDGKKKIVKRQLGGAEMEPANPLSYPLSLDACMACWQRNRRLAQEDAALQLLASAAGRGARSRRGATATAQLEPRSRLRQSVCCGWPAWSLTQPTSAMHAPSG